MVNNSFNKTVIYFFFAIIATLFMPFQSVAQMPPHPSLIEKFQTQKDLAVQSFYLQNKASFKSRGIDAPWSSSSLNINKSPSGQTFQRNIGPGKSPSGTWNALVIFVKFSDKPAQVQTSSFDNLLFGSSYGSLRDFYKKVSYGNLDIVTVNLPSTMNWVTASQPYSYYVNNQNGFGNYPQNAQKLVEEAVQLVDPLVDFSKYDNDKDGYVDALFVVHAGPGAEFTGNNADIWSHSWSTSSPISVDGVKVYRYSMEPEYWESPGDMTMGVYAHELGHAAFGLPDLYDTDYSSEGLGDWSLMAGGSWNGTAPGGNSPAMPDAWCQAQMGYVNPTTITTNTSALSIPQKETNAKSFILWKNGSFTNEYFLIENRQRTDYDTYLPGDGLLVYHVDNSITTENTKEWYPGFTSSSHYLVALEQADGLWDLERNHNRGDAGDPFPGSTNNTNFTNSTTPDTKDYTLSATGTSIKNISGSGQIMTADMTISTSDKTLRIVSPNGGERWPEGYTKQIVLDALNTGTVAVEYSTDNGSSWTLINNVDPSAKLNTGDKFCAPGVQLNDNYQQNITGSVITWVVPNFPSDQCKIRATSIADPTLTDMSDNTFSIFAVPPGQFSLEFNYDANAVTGANGNLGSIFIPGSNEFWTSRWASNLMHRWTKSGTLIEQFSITGVNGVLGFTYDGTNIYATQNNTKDIKIISPANKTVVGDITAPFNPLYITYDPTADNGKGGFWIGNFETDLTLINRSGTVLKTWPYANLSSADNIGAAFDSYTPGGQYLWLASQTPNQRVVQINLTTGLPTGLEHNLSADIGAGISGSLFITTGLVNGKATLGGMFQGTPDHLFGYQLCDLVPNITVISPNGGERFKVGSAREIKWTSGLVDKVKIEYTVDGGTNWLPVADNLTASTGTFSWTVPNSLSTNCKVRISDQSNSSLNDVSDAAFTIATTGVVIEIEPNDTIQQAMSVSYADTVDASINPIGDIDYYKFQATSGDTLTIYAENRNGSQLTGNISLLDVNGNYIIRYIEQFTGNSFKQRYVFVAPSTSTYYIRYSYWGNMSGTPAAADGKTDKLTSGNPPKPKMLEGAPYDQGDYLLTINHFKNAAPLVGYIGWSDLNYNSVRLYGDFVPNGLPTNATIEFGTTTSYGTSLILATNLNSLNEWGNYVNKITGLTANSIYHFRLRVENSMGVVYSGDAQFTTPAAPDSWAFVNSGTTETIYAVKFYDSNIGYAAGYSGLLKTIDGGISWTNVRSNNYYRSIEVLDGNTVIAGGGNIISKTTNGGTSWTDIQNISCTVMGVSFKDANNGVFVTDCGEMYKTTDIGGTWNKLTLGLSNLNLYTVKYLSNGTIIAAGWNDYIIRSTNDGTSWTSQQLSGSSYAFWSMSFKDNSNGIMVGYGGMVFKTTNGGSSWASVTSGINYDQYGISYQSNGSAISVGVQGTIYRSGDDGSTWTRQQSGTTNYLYGVNTIGNGSALMIGGDWGTLLRNGDFIKVVSPNGGENWKIGSGKTISWSTSSTNKVKIELSTNNGAAWSTIATDVNAGLGKYIWTVPNSISSQCLVRITDQTNNNLSDQSDGVFSIIKTGPLAEIEPNNTMAQAMLVSYADTVNASINPIGDIDYYKINCVAGDTLMLYAENRNNSSLNGNMSLLDASGNWINYYIQNFTGDFSKQRYVYIVPTTATYYVRYSYWGNMNGMPAQTVAKKKSLSPEDSQKPKLLQGAPYDQGDYMITFSPFKKGAPLAGVIGWSDLNYNSVRLYGDFVPNGLPTNATIEYGLTTSYGTTLVLASNVNSLNEWGNYTDKITGLTPNTTYHFRMRVENSMGVVYSGDGLVTTVSPPDGWTFENSGTSISLRTIKYFDSNVGYAAGDGGILKTTDGGSTWVSKKTNNDYNALEVIDVNTVIGVGYNGIISKTTDGGSTWNDKTTGCYGNMAVSFKDATNGVFVTYCGELYKTTDEGGTWNKLTLGVTNQDLYTVKYISNGTIIAAGYNDYVIRSTNDGASWTIQQLSGSSFAFESMSFKDNSNGIMVGTSGMVFKTTDAGSTWNSVNPGHTYDQYGVFYQGNGTAVSVGMAGMIYKSVNDGSTWIQQQSGTTNYLYGINAVGNTSTFMIVGDWGTMLKSAGPKISLSVNLTVQDKNNTHNASLTFGTSPDAYDGLDTGLGEAILPPVPPTGIFDSRFIFPDGTTASLKDFRKDGQDTVTWKITFQPGSSGYPMTFTWDNTTLTTAGSFILTDEVTGTIVNVDMKANSSYSLTNTGIKTLLIKYSRLMRVKVNLAKDWNILSVPVTAANMNTTILFPDFGSSTYLYNDGYNIISTLVSGSGYWLKYLKDTTLTLSGVKVGTTTVPVKKEWNLIGVYDWPVPVSGITTTPDGIISSQFFEYNSGYVVPTTLSPGKGYWIKVSSDGVINLPAASSSSGVTMARMAGFGGPTIVNGQKNGLSINIADAAGRSKELRLLKEVGSTENYDLPPMPPRGVYEVRWSSDKNVEKSGTGIKELVINSAEYPITVTVTGGDVRIKDVAGGQIVNQIVRKGGTISISKSGIDKLSIEELDIPADFKLFQNYPNPFNPDTKIEYWVPDAGKVTLKIYDVLGREVARLVDQIQDPGKYEVRWRAGNYSSGVYYYSIMAGSNHSVKKMILLK
jgi:immune inhibitor A